MVLSLKMLDARKPRDWRSWLDKNHETEDGVWLVFHKKGSREPSISYDEAIDEALAYGWIDSVIRRIDESRYARKFTPRRPWSIWSKLNIDRVMKLTEEGRMTRWGLTAFEKSPDADLADEQLLGITILSIGGRTNVPAQVRDVLKLRPTRRKREKLLWTQEGNEVVVTKGTPQSSFRKTMFSRDGTAAVPRHIREALKLKSTLYKEDRILWVRRGEEVVVRKGTPQSIREMEL